MGYLSKILTWRDVHMHTYNIETESFTLRCQNASRKERTLPLQNPYSSENLLIPVYTRATSGAEISPSPVIGSVLLRNSETISAQLSNGQLMHTLVQTSVTNAMVRTQTRATLSKLGMAAGVTETRVCLVAKTDCEAASNVNTA